MFDVTNKSINQSNVRLVYKITMLLFICLTMLFIMSNNVVYYVLQCCLLCVTMLSMCSKILLLFVTKLLI